MATDHDIARWRLRTQRLVGPHVAAATQVVVDLLAVQAENQRQSEWAVASRTTNPSAAKVAAHARKRVLAIADHTTITVTELHTGEILSTHQIDPTKTYWRNQKEARADGPGPLPDVTHDATHMSPMSRLITWWS